MFNILVVDDEAWIRKGIIAKLNKLQLPINKILEADSSELALQLLDVEQIHIVISDICMSEMNGLQLIRHLRNRPHMKFIVVSGYAEFDYAKEALELEVSGYLLKPIKEKELGDLLVKVMGELSEESNFDSRHYQLEQEVNDYLHGSGLPSTLLDDENNYLAMAVLDIGITRYERLMDAKKEIVKTFETATKDYEVKVINNYNDNKQLILILGAESREAMQKVKNWYLFSCYQRIKDRMSINITIGVSNVMPNLRSQLYEEATIALLNKFVSGNQGIYYYKKQILPGNAFSKELKQLEKYIECNDIKKIRGFIDDLFQTDNYNEENIASIKYYYNEMVYFLRYTFREVINKSTPCIVLDNTSSILFYDNMMQVKAEIIAFVEDHMDDGEQVGSVKDVIWKAKKYVDKHYDEDMSIKELAYRVGINSNYLSTLFKKETGKTFTKYLTDLRIDNAKRLLADTSANVAQISRSVGYQDPGYFYRVFKKETGQTPLNYRKNS